MTTNQEGNFKVCGARIRLYQEGDTMHLLHEDETPHEYMVPVKAGDIAAHREFGDVQIQYSIEHGWHYLRWGNASVGVDFENVALSREFCVARMTESRATEKNAEFPQLQPDAPEVPDGMQPKEGVEYGCGKATCCDCYEARA